jgi:3-deoxy-D-manno-octulosonic-acid transferase
MWKLIYNLLIHAALPFFTAYSLTNKKIRTNFAERMFPAPAPSGLRDPIWIHAASIGEGVIAQNLVAYARKEMENDFVITTNTFYTRDMLRPRMAGAATVLSLPFDVPSAISRFIGPARFAALLLVETEIWPNLIWTAKRRHIPVVIINGRISDSTVGRYRRLSFFLRSVLASVDCVLAQSEEHARRFISLGIDPSRVITTGNLKYYREGAAGAAGTKEHIVTFGSIREKELPAVASVIARLRENLPGIRVYVVPRELHLVTTMEDQFKGAVRYSAVKAAQAAEGDIVLVDTVGDLLAIYARSSVAFVGGSLEPYGGQNILEPLFVGTPVVFGPHVANFRDAATAIIDHAAGFMVRDADELFSVILRVLSDAGLRDRLADAGRALLAQQKQVMEKTLHHIRETICRNSPGSLS